MNFEKIRNRLFVGEIWSKVILFVCIIVAIIAKEYIFCVTMVGALFLSILFGEFSYRRGVRHIHAYLKDIRLHADAAESMPGFPFPAVSVTDKGIITWYNSAMDKMMEGELLFQKNIREYANDIDMSTVTSFGDAPVCHAKIKNKTYSLYAHQTPSQVDEENLIILYFLDVNDYACLQKKYKDERHVSILAVFDNYEEVMQGLEDEMRNAIQSAFDRKISSAIGEVNGIIKKTERDRYAISVSNAGLQVLLQKKFQVLDAVREIQNGNTISPTLSMGVGLDGESFAENDMFARTALDMALGRGGDQVVLKDKNALQYFGGKTREVERRTKVKARVIALALRELILQSGNVVIIGHKHADIDCIGAAMGIVAIARSLKKNAHILLYDYDDTAAAFAKKAMRETEYQNVFLRPESMNEVLSSKTLVMVLDTNSLSYLETTEFFGISDQVALIDHHRKSGNFIQNTTLSYHEPYASSTCELVTEMLPYLGNKDILSKIDAEALYAGIYLDTKCFTFKTGVRTLEAAAYLRRSGVDPITVKTYFKSDLKTYGMKSSLIQGAKIINDNIAISVTEEERTPSIIAQAADELLNIASIETSFVIAQNASNCVISGRSTGTVNVQIILEKLGGGGHFSVAGAQLKNVSSEEAEKQLIHAINDYFAEI